MAFLQDYASDMFWIALAIVLLFWVGLKKSKENLNKEEPFDEDPTPNPEDPPEEGANR